MDEETWVFYSEMTENLSKEYPVSFDEIFAGNVEEWASEGYEISKEYVYLGFTEGK